MPNGVHDTGRALDRRRHADAPGRAPASTSGTRRRDTRQAGASESSAPGPRRAAPARALSEAPGDAAAGGYCDLGGSADSLNPTTVGPALYLATLRRRIWRVTLFTTGVFSVNLAVGLVLTIGPGRLLLGLVPNPQRTAGM